MALFVLDLGRRVHRFIQMKRLLGFGALVVTAALVGARVTRKNLHWYRLLNKPSYQPPEALFGPVWTGLYSLMAWSAWRVSGQPSSAARNRALALWAAQYGLNFAWSPLFFGARRPRLALVDLCWLFASLAGYTAAAARVDRAAAVVMAPYLGWVGFAGLLNAEVARRN
jgi:tryptophan-rich sensory protein